LRHYFKSANHLGTVPVSGCPWLRNPAFSSSYSTSTEKREEFCSGIFKQSMGARNRAGIRLLHRPARLADLIPWDRFLDSLNNYKFGLWPFRASHGAHGCTWVLWVYSRCSWGCLLKRLSLFKRVEIFDTFPTGWNFGVKRKRTSRLQALAPFISIRSPYEVLDFLQPQNQGFTKRCRRLSFLTNNALVIRVQMRGAGGSCGVSANEYSCAHHVTWSPNKNFGDPPPSLTYGREQWTVLAVSWRN
jgi:hypothetical protein